MQRRRDLTAYTWCALLPQVRLTLATCNRHQMVSISVTPLLLSSGQLERMREAIRGTEKRALHRLRAEQKRATGSGLAQFPNRSPAELEMARKRIRAESKRRLAHLYLEQRLAKLRARREPGRRQTGGIVSRAKNAIIGWPGALRLWTEMV